MNEPYEHRAPTRAELRGDLNDLANWLTEKSANSADAMQLSRWADAVGEAAAALADTEQQTSSEETSRG